jgi:hypothetical protein
MGVFHCRSKNPERKDLIMVKTKSIVIAVSTLMLIGGWVALPLMMAAEGEPQPEQQRQRPQAVPEGGMRRQAGQGGMQPGQMDPQAMQRMSLERTKNELAATDQEWVAIEPLLKKVMALSNDITPRGMGMGMGMMGERPERRADQPERPADQVSQSEFQKASVALREVTQKADAAPKEISDKLAAFRAAKAAAQKELAAEQDKLKKVLTPRQEAKLVLMGTLN